MAKYNIVKTSILIEWLRIMKKSVALIVLILLLFPHKILAEEVLVDQYKTDIGITINSYSESWTGNKLVEVYDELRKNTYGEELKYLKEINLYNNNPLGGKEEGVYNASYNKLSFLGNEKIFLSKNNSIDLFNLESKDEVEDFAKTLSHEYGHHFTLYYLIQYENKTFEQWEDTRLYRSRGLKNYEKVTNDYSNGHEWSIIEIIAEDYVQLYGSPTAKKIIHFDDIEGRYSSGTINKSTSYSYSIFNINPQENNYIPLALELPEIKQYWEQASGILSGVESASKPILALTNVKQLGYDKIQYEFQWSKSIDSDDQEATYYTLVTSNLNKDEIIPIKTVEKGDSLEAVVGSIRVEKDRNIMFYTDSFIDSPKLFRVYAINASGGIVSSESLMVDFDKPIVTNIESLANQTTAKEVQKVDEVQQMKRYNNGNKYIDKVLDFIFSLIEKFVD